MKGPLLTQPLHQALLAARDAGASALDCSVDLELSRTTVQIAPQHWSWNGRDYPYPAQCKERTVYWWDGAAFEPAARYAGSLIKLVPTEWGTPTFEIDGIKMLVSAQVSPWEDARRKVALVEPRGKAVLDTCGGLGYFAAWCLRGGAARIDSHEKNPDVVWLRGLNPWSPEVGGALSLAECDIAKHIATLPDQVYDAALHDPPRFGIAGELYSQAFYDQLARVLKRRGRLFHYTGAPNQRSHGRDLPGEVARRLQRSGFSVERSGDGVLAVKG